MTSTDELNVLKLTAEIKGQHMHLPREAAKKLQSLLMDESLSPEEFKRELEQVFSYTKTVSWQIRSLFSDLFSEAKNYLFFNIKNLFSHISLLEVFIFLGVFLLGYLFYQKFKYNKIFRWFLSMVKGLLVNFCASLGYLMPFLQIINIYGAPLVRTYPYLKFVLTPFIQVGIIIYKTLPGTSFTYTCLLYAVFIRYRRPRNRFIRYHFVLGMLFMNMHSTLNLIYRPLLAASGGNFKTIESIAFVFFMVSLMYLIPHIYTALRGKYTKNALLRDNVEIIVGRDHHDPDFKWWNRE